MKIPSFAYFVRRRYGTGEPVGRPHKRTTYILLILILFLLPVITHAQKSGAFYFGDSDSNGVIEVPDLITLNTVLGDFSADDTLLYSGYPQSRYRQDLDGNGVIEIPDMIILNTWLSSDFSNRPGNPDRLLLDGATHLNLNLGDSITLSAYALSPIAAGSQVRTGFGVIFKIDPSSTCTTAQIRGYDVAGGATVNAWRSNSAYHYTLQPAAPGNGRTSVRINTSGCNPGQTIKVEFYIPDDTEAGVAPGRFPSKLPASQKFSISVKPIHDYWVENTILRNIPDPRTSHTAVWTGTEMIIWGGNYGSVYFNSGSRYNPSTNSWTATSTFNAPSGRSSHTAVWTGNEMIVWGGYYNDGSDNYLYTGGIYNPSTDSWVATSTIDAPQVRYMHTVVWTGNEMIVWGGKSGSSRLNTGGRYNPSTDSWLATSITNAPSIRYDHSTVWTGTEMIVWGGGLSGLNTGGRYDPVADSWTATTITNAPAARYYHTAVWTGDEMIVWGGHGSTPTYKNDGGRYDPNTDSWTATTTTNAPAARDRHTAVWTGDVMVVWGGYNGSYLNTGGRYNPSTDTWVSTSLGLSARRGHTAVWTGTKMIVWGGYDGSKDLNTGSRYDPSTNSWSSTFMPLNVPSARIYKTNIWTGNEMIVWGGYDGSILYTGGKYNPSTDSWIATSTTNAPILTDYHYTAVWTGNEMIIWGIYIGFQFFNNVGGRYNPSTNSWTTPSTTDAPAPRWLHTAIWTGTKMIVWGGRYTPDAVHYYDYNDGGVYSPATDSWTATSTTNAPSERSEHTAVWTGTEMIIWGGCACLGTQGPDCFPSAPGVTGGKYNPNTDSWTATSITNAPSARKYHTAVWTGTEMIVWGGNPTTDTGGRYNPSADSWSATTITNAPVGRQNHTAVWTGTLMVVWGGYGVGYQYLDTGGRYDPSADSWTSTTDINAPSGRTSHTAVWTGNEMIIWGGSNESTYYYNSGGKYVP